MLDAVNAKPTDDPRLVPIKRTLSLLSFIVLKTIKHFIFRERAAAIFQKIDINNDGELNREEFLMGCQQDQVNYLKKALINIQLYLIKYSSYAVH